MKFATHRKNSENCLWLPLLAYRIIHITVLIVVTIDFTIFIFFLFPAVLFFAVFSIFLFFFIFLT
jgi:hypothetical protein